MDERNERYARHITLDGFGAEAQESLARARVLVLGAGGLGSPVITYLVAAGVRRLTVVDDDVVTVSNLQRQVIHATPDLGRPKAQSAADRARALNPHVEVTPVVQRLTDANADALVAEHDLAVDATDTFTSRTALADACARAGIPEVYGAVLGWGGHVTVLDPGRALTDLFGPFPDDAPTCASAGVLATVPAVIGSVMAAEAIKVATSAGETLAGRLQTYDARTATWRTFTLPPLAHEHAASAPAPPTNSEEHP